MLITLDIETCPSQSPELRADFLANVKAPAQYKKPESIAEWMKENAEAEAEQAWRKTSFDGAYGHVCVIGLALDGNDPVALYNDNWHANEASVLRRAFDWIDGACSNQPNERPIFIGHNLVEFDLRFLFQRAVVLGVKPSRHIPFAAKPWDDAVFDTMTRWSGVKDRVKLDKLAKVCGLDGKGDIDGSMVWDYVRDGRIAEIAEYCRHDVALARAIYKRMTFAELQAA
jgi:3'-5' exonuclease